MKNRFPLSVIELLDNKIKELQAGIRLDWKIPPSQPRDPLSLVPQKRWKSWFYTDPLPLARNRKSWFYAEVELPREHCGFRLGNREGWMFINGWWPFTMWHNGRELFREKHPWLATGPIAEPVELAPGQKHRFVLCLEPTSLPVIAMEGHPIGVFTVDINYAPCVAKAWELGAAAFQLQYAAVIAGGLLTNKHRSLVLPTAGAGRNIPPPPGFITSFIGARPFSIATGFASNELLPKKTTTSAWKLVDHAAALVNSRALVANDWTAVDASIAQMEQVLAPLSKLARTKVIHLVGHTHIDMDWMWTWTDTVHCVRRDLRAVVEMMDDHPKLTFVHSQVPTYQIIQKKDPEVFEKIKRRIAEGRWENVAGTWVEGDLNMADGESIARHILYATDWTKTNLGAKSRLIWEPDTFGHPGNMPQLAKLGEFEGYYHWRCNPGQWDSAPARRWEGVDGTPIVALSRHYGSTLEPWETWLALWEGIRHGRKNILMVWGLGDHGGGLPRFQLRLLERYRHKPLMPTIKFSTITQVLEATRKENLPCNKGETFSLFEGCFTTHASIKRYNRQCEGALLNAEALCAMAKIERRAVLRRAWKGVLFNQFHDILDGAAVQDSYVDAHQRAEYALGVARKVSRESIVALEPSRSNGSTLTVFNATGFNRTEPVRARLPVSTVALEDEDGKVIPVQKFANEFIFIAEDIPAFSRKNYRILTRNTGNRGFSNISATEDSGMMIEFFKIETDGAIVRLSKQSGVIGSYFDKSIGCDLVGYGIPRSLSHVNVTRADMALNVFQILDESHNPTTAWTMHNVVKEQSLLTAAEVKLREIGPVFARFTIKHRFRSSAIEEEMLFYKNCNRVDFKATIDWKERGNREVGVPLLKVSFCAAISASRARFEGPYFITQRPADGSEQPTQKFLDVTGDEFGFVLLNDSKYGCDVLGSRARITLLRNPYCPDPETDNGIHTVRFAFQPHGPDTARTQGMSNAALTRAGLAFNRPLVTVRTSGPLRPFKPMLQLDNESVVVTALRWAEHSQRLIVCLFETSGKPGAATLTMHRPIQSAHEVNFLENPTGGKLRFGHNHLSLTFHKFEVKMVLLELKQVDLHQPASSSTHPSPEDQKYRPQPINSSIEQKF